MNIIPNRYNIENFKEATKNPDNFVGEISYILNQSLGKWYFRHKYGGGIDIMDEDWDTLIILDACRYDTFEEVVDIEGELEYRISKGSSSEEFYLENFLNKHHFDTVYVTANPYGASICQKSFYRMETTFTGDIEFHKNKPRVEKVTTSDGKTYLDRNIKNLRPKEVTALAHEVHNEHPDKRLIVHYMQPHKPYLSKHAEQLREDLAKEDNILFDRFHPVDKIKEEKEAGKTIISDLMNATSKGYLSAEKLREIYVENLEIVLDYAKDFILEIDGKTVITSDHGELLGERRGGKRFDHPGGVYAKELRKVPWFIIEDGSRREIIKENPVTHNDISEEVLSHQLELLGYK